MIRFIAFFTIILTINSLGISQEGLEKRVSLSDVIVEGTVTEKHSYWNEKRTAIFTSNKVEIHKVFKGTIESEYLTIITSGGIVDEDFQIIPHSHQVETFQEGIFFLEWIEDSYCKMARLKKPQIVYLFEGGLFGTDEGIQSYNNPKNLYSDIQRLTAQNYVQVSTNTTEENIAKWLKETLSVMSLTDTLIEFTFENIELINPDRMAFDIMVKSNQDGIRFAASDVYLAYDSLAFGINVVANEKIEAEKETVIEDEVYTLELTDETSSVIKLLVDSDFVPNNLYYLSQVAEKLLHVEIDIANIVELSNISFDGFSMSNQSLFYDEISDSFVSFDRVLVDDPFTAFLIPGIGSISPNPVPAGTRLNEDILTITKTDDPGNGFGDHNNPDGTFNTSCTECRVRFVNSDNPSTGYVYARGRDILSWTDSEIRLNIPSATATGTSTFGNSAASGGMRVESPTGNSNEVDINIPYSVLNFQNSPNIATPAKRFASEMQSPEGIIFNYHSSTIGGVKVECDRAFDRWCNATDIGWKVSDVILQDTDIAGLLNGNDNRNVISVQPDSEFQNPSAKAFVKITGHFTGCGPSNTDVIYIRDVDIALNDDDFISDEADNWYNFILHELGHAHLLYHSINPDLGVQDEYIMFHDMTLINNIGAGQNNLYRHYLHSVIEEGAETVFPSSANLLALCPNVDPITAIGCTGVNSSQTLTKTINDIYTYPNPNMGQEIILSLDLDESLDLSIDLFTITNLHIATFELIKGALGENNISLPLPSNLASGTYLISVSTKKGTYYSKFIQL